MPSAAAGARELIAHGSGLPGHGFQIVNPDSRHRCLPGQLGEIWAQGPSVGLGYWQDKSSDVLFNAQTVEGDGPFLRTGDLGFVHAGQLYITGRLKDILILRGQNFQANDIAWSVMRAHAAIRFGGVCVWEDDSAMALVVAAELKVGKACIEEVLTAIRSVLRINFGVKLSRCLLLPDKALLKTTSGKARHGDNQARWQANTLPVLVVKAGSQPHQLAAPLDVVQRYCCFSTGVKNE